MLHRLANVVGIFVICLSAAAMPGEDVTSPRQVKVLPIFFVPKGEQAPTPEQTQKLMRHLEWSQRRYAELLPEKMTFEIAEQKPRTYRSGRALHAYRAMGEEFGPQVVIELLESLQVNRYTCPYILLVVMMNPKDDFPIGGGRPLNGGLNTGGGLIVLSSFALDQVPNFQSTLQHELGHSFGLPHVDVYGYDMSSNTSLMSYNLRHRSSGFTPSLTPGAMISEDLRGLALNKRVFPKLVFDPNRDIPSGYSMSKKIVPLGPMKLAGQPDAVQISTQSGEEFESKVSNCVQGQIIPSQKTGQITFDASKMWCSAETKSGWVSLEILFPTEVVLSKVAIHSQHSGEYHGAAATRIAVGLNDKRFREVVKEPLKDIDAIVDFPKTKGRVWQFDFQAGPSKVVVLRGLRFFSGEDELFPPLVPYQP